MRVESFVSGVSALAITLAPASTSAVHDAHSVPGAATGRRPQRGQSMTVFESLATDVRFYSQRTGVRSFVA